MSDFTTTFGDSTLILTNNQDIELGTAQLGDQFGTIKRAIIRRMGDRELIQHAKTKKLLMVLIHNPGFEMMLECAFAKSVTPPGMGESLSLPLVGVTGFIMEGVTVQWEAGSERGLMIPVTAWDTMQEATAYRLTNSGEQVSLGVAGLAAPTEAPTLAGSVTSSSTATSWTTVARATTYQLQVSSDSGSTWSTLTSANVSSYTHSGLSPSAARRYRVRASNTAGDGPWSDSLDLTTSAVAPSSAPTLTGIVQTTEYDLRLTWTIGVLYAADYELQVSSDSGSTWSTLSTQEGATYLHVLGSAGTTRRYRVRARNGVGNGPFSASVNLTTVSMAAPTLSAAATVSAVGLSWSPRVLAADYQVQKSDDAGSIPGQIW